MDRFCYFPNHPYAGTPPFVEPLYQTFVNNYHQTTVFNGEQSSAEMVNNINLQSHQQICAAGSSSPSVLQTLLNKDDHHHHHHHHQHSTMQMDVSPSTSNNISVSMLNGSRGLQMMPNFAAVKTEPASGNISAPIGFSSVKSEPPISNYGGKMCTKFEQHGSSSPMLANGIGGSSGVDEKPYICAGCNYKIVDRYLLNAADKVWHENCLRCYECHCQLTEENKSLFLKNNKIYCRNDYRRLFGVKGKCSACHNVIPPLDQIMRAGANVYHLDCFACQECSYRFCIGDRFYLDFDNNKILCERDYTERMYFARLSNCNSPNLAQLKRQISYQVEDMDEIHQMQR